MQNTSGHLLLYFTDSARSKKILRRHCDVISVAHKLSRDAVMQTSFYRRLHGVFNPASFSRRCNDIWFSHQKSRPGYVVPQSSFRRLWPLGCVRVKVTEDFLTSKNTQKHLTRFIVYICIKLSECGRLRFFLQAIFQQIATVFKNRCLWTITA